MKDKNEDIKRIKGAFRHMLHEYKLDSKYTATLIKSSWEKLMGRPIASRTSQISLNNGKLRVKLTSAPLKNELNMSKSKILAMLEEEFGEGIIREIVFI